MDENGERNLIVTGSLDNHVKFWKWSESTLRLQCEHDRGQEHQLGVLSVQLSSDGTVAVSSSTDCSLRVWATETGEQRTCIEAPTCTDAWTVALSPDALLVATGTAGGQVHIFDSLSGQLLHTIDTEGHKFILSLDFSPDGRRLACSSWEGIVYLIDTEQWKIVTKFEAHSMPIRRLRFARDSRHLLTCCDDKYAKVFNVADDNHTIVATLTGHTNWVLCGDMSTRSDVVTASSDGTCRVYDVRGGGEKTVQILHNRLDSNAVEAPMPVWTCTFAVGDGRRLLTAGEDKCIYVFGNDTTVDNNDASITIDDV